LLDQRLKLDERLTTALELATSSRETPDVIIQAQLRDTLRHLHGLDPAHLFPLDFSWRWLMLVNLLLIAIAVGLIAPNPQIPILQRWLQEQEAIAAQVEHLEEIRVDLLEDPALLETPQGEEALKTLDDLLASLQDNQVNPEEALADISAAEQHLAELQQGAANKEKTLNEVAESLNQFSSTSDLAEALEQRNLAQANEFLQSAAETAASNPEAAQNLAEALQEAAETAQEAGDSALAESLSQAAEALQQNLAAQQSGNPAEAQAAQQTTQEALQQAAEALAQAEQQAGSQEALEQALGNIQEAREQLAEAAGQGEGEGEGQQQASGQGQGQNQGQTGEGSGNGPGLGQGGSGSGRGEAGDAPADLFADRPGGELETDNGPNEGRLGDYEGNYPPIHWGGDGGPLVNPDPKGAEGGLPIGEAPLDPNQTPNPSQVPYNQVYGQYSEAASEALEDTYIPLGMKEYVRDYFGALEPGQ
jgi:chemotaxis protein histidine kinase CheA